MREPERESEKKEWSKNGRLGSQKESKKKERGERRKV